MKFLIDKKINLETDDLLNTSSYATALQDIIEESPKDLGFTIGLFGEWGSGKSSIIETACMRISNDRRRNIKIVMYDAWKYSNDSFRRTFLLQARKDLGLEKHYDLEGFYQAKTEDKEIKRKFSWTYFMSIISILTVGGLLIYLINDMVTDIALTAALLISIVGVVVSFLGRAFNELKVAIVTPPVFAAEQFELHFNNLLDKIFSNKRKPVDRVIIVIDNIDRCPNNIAYQLLTDIKTFLADKSGVIFIIPIDDGALKGHISRQKETDGEAEEFFRKLFNVTLRIKPYKTFDLYDFAEGINRKCQLGFNPTTIDVISEEYASNPRRIIQFFNNLAAEIHTCGLIYGKDFAKEHESIICKILVIREEWPDYYKVLAKNPNMLNKKTSDNDYPEIYWERYSEKLRTFLDVTLSVNINTEYELIEKVFSIYDRGATFPSIVAEAISKMDVGSIEKALKDGIIQHDKLVNELIERLEKGLKLHRYQVAVNNTLEMISRLNKVESLSTDENRRVSDQISNYLTIIVKNVGEFDFLCEYGADIYSKNFKYLNDFLTKTIEAGVKNNKESEDYQLAKRIMVAYIKIPANEKDVPKLAAVFTNIYTNSDGSIDSFGLSEEILRVLIEDKLINHAVEHIKDFYITDQYYDDLLKIAKIVSFSEDMLDVICAKFNQLIPSLDNIEKNEMVLRLNSFNKLFSNLRKGVNNDSRMQHVEVIFRKVTGERVYGGVRIRVISEFQSEQERLIAAHLFVNISKLSNEHIDVESNLVHFVNNSTVAASVFPELVKMSETGIYSLSAAKDAILSSDLFNDDHIKLLSFLFYQNGQEDQFSDESLKEQLRDLIMAAANRQIEPLTRAIDEWAETERIKIALLDIIPKLSKDYLIRLSEKLFMLAFGNIAEGNNVLTYQNSVDILKAVANKGTSEQIDKVLLVVENKLREAEKLNEGVDILDEIPSLKLTQINFLKKVVVQLPNNPLRNEALQIINNKDESFDFSSHSGLEIIRSIYSSDRNMVERNVTRKVRNLVVSGNLNLTITNDLVDGNDPDPGHVKDFYLKYAYNGLVSERLIKEGAILEVP